MKELLTTYLPLKFTLAKSPGKKGIFVEDYLIFNLLFVINSNKHVVFAREMAFERNEDLASVEFRMNK